MYITRSKAVFSGPLLAPQLRHFQPQISARMQLWRTTWTGTAWTTTKLGGQEISGLECTGISASTPGNSFLNASLTALSFHQDIPRECYAQTPKATLERAGVRGVKLYLIYRVRASPKGRRGEGFTSLECSDPARRCK